MNVLQTLPRLRNAGVIRETQNAGIDVRMGVYPHTRALAARQLRAAVARGKVSARAARAAMSSSDIAVAALLRPHTAQLPMPQISEHALRELPRTGVLPVDQLNGLLDLAAVLVSDGDLDIGRMQELARRAPDAVRLVEALQQAWQARCERLTAAVLPNRPTDAYHCFLVTLTPILDAIRALSNGAHGPLDQFDASDIQGEGAVIELTDWPLVRLPAHPVHEPEFFRAFTGVWKAIEDACGKPQMMYGIDRHLSAFGGSLAEAFEDAITTATWVDGVPQITAAARNGLQEDFGVEDPDQLTDELIGYRNWYEAANCRGWSPDSDAFEQFVKHKATSEQAQLLGKLCGLLKHLRQVPQISQLAVAPHYAGTGDGPLEVMLLPHDYGIDDFITPWIENIYESGETPMLCVTHPSAQNMAHVLAVADQVTVSAIVATYCLNEVADYVHEQRRRAAAHPTA